MHHHSLSGINTRVPKKEELITINIIHPSSQERDYSSNRPLSAQAPPRPISEGWFHLARLWGRTPPRPTIGSALRLARPLGLRSVSLNPWVCTPPRPTYEVAGSALPDL